MTPPVNVTNKNYQTSTKKLLPDIVTLLLGAGP
jgi:hypothetical protein